MVKQRQILKEAKNVKTWEELAIEDDFLFQKVMENQDICQHFLEKVLNRKIKNLKYNQNEKGVNLSPENKGVRFDILVETADGVMIDVEMQTSDKSQWLPKRTRYYQAMIDLNTLAKGSSYKKLPESYIVFICTFDPFDKSRKVYTFKNQCSEENFELGDGATRIFYNTTGVIGKVDEDIENFLNYIETKKVNGTFAKKVAAEVERLKAHDALKLEYMSLFARMTDARDEGREEGLEQGKINTLLENIKSLITKEGWSINKAFDVLGVTPEDRAIVEKNFQ